MPSRVLQVLVVEDHPIVRRLLLECLALDGHTVEAAADGEAGWAAFQAGQFDLVITDRDLPGTDGDQLAVAIKRVTPGQPVLMLTGHGDAMLAVGQLPAGVDAVLGKPFGLAALRATVVQVTSKG